MPRLEMALSQNGATMPQRGNGHAAERRTERARDVDADAIRRDRGGEIVLGDESRHDSLPGRRGQRAGGTDQKREGQQIDRRRQTKADHRGIDRRHDRVERFDHDQIFALIEDVGERAGRNREHTNRQRARRLHQRHDQRIGIEAGHQPARRGAVHPAADIGDQCRGPDHRERRMPERRNERRRFRRSRGRRSWQYGPRDGRFRHAKVFFFSARRTIGAPLCVDAIAT